MNNRLPQVVGALLALTLLGAVGYYGFIFKDKTPPKAAWKARDATIAELEARLQELADQIKGLQGQSDCESDDQCRVVGIGARVCGRYKNFVVYSTRDTDETALLPVIQDFNTTHEKLTDLSLAANECGVLPAAAHCIQKVCTVGAAR